MEHLLRKLACAVLACSIAFPAAAQTVSNSAQPAPPTNVAGADPAIANARRLMEQGRFDDATLGDIAGQVRAACTEIVA